ncbi:UNVERIFIED_CONTAM: hypothetical protein NCL1_37086 [Trichonephila clavipes]
MLFGDHFHLNDSVHTQIASEQPHAVHKTRMHPPKVTVGCGFLIIHLFGYCHFGRTNERVISHDLTVAWPPCSPDLILCDFWLTGYFKSKVNVDRVET